MTEDKQLQLARKCEKHSRRFRNKAPTTTTPHCERRVDKHFGDEFERDEEEVAKRGVAENPEGERHRGRSHARG